MEITVYSKPNCMACRLTKRWLDDHHFEYTDIDFTKDDRLMNQLREKGLQSAPVVEINGDTICTGFDIKALNQIEATA